MSKPNPLLTTPVQIGENLVLRRSTRQDTEPLAEFNARIHGENPDDGQHLTDWTHDLLRRIVPGPDQSCPDYPVK